MIVNGNTLLELAPIKNMSHQKQKNNGVSHGLGEAGYDIRIKQTIEFLKGNTFPRIVMADGEPIEGRFSLASTIEEFQMPANLVGIVHDKSTWARQGLSVFNTVIEPGFKGGLTLELVYHGDSELIIPAGSGIAQVIFHSTTDTANYSGKYANQPDRPVGPIESI